MQRRQRPINKPGALSRVQLRRELVASITADDMRAQLNRLAGEGRRDDCLALMQELGDWQSKDGNTIIDALDSSLWGHQAKLR
ncbi:MAG: hypothetical protein ACON4T_04785 [Synechococcus sp.]